MNARTLLLNSENMRRDQLVEHIMKLICPDPEESDAWAMGVFEAGLEDDCMTRQLVVFGKLQDCADAVAGCLSREPSLVRLQAFQCPVAEIDCRSNDICF